jgi:hypothetical protein
MDDTPQSTSPFLQLFVGLLLPVLLADDRVNGRSRRPQHDDQTPRSDERCNHVPLQPRSR